MIVHLVASIRDFELDPEYIRGISETIHDCGAVLAHNWLEAALTRKREEIYIADWTPFVENDLQSIKRADVVIVDLTHYAFSHGFQVAAALEQKKPILAVTRHPSNGKTVRGLADPLFTYQQYTNKSELQTLTRNFLKKNTVHTKDLRFNIFLTRHIFKYLEEISNETGKNKSDIIRDVIKRHTQTGKFND